MPSAKDFREAREQRRAEEEYRAMSSEFFEDMFGDYSPLQPEPQRFDPNKTDDRTNFMLGVLGPHIDAAAEGKEGGSADFEALQEEQDAFLEQQAVLREQEMENHIRAGLYAGSPLARMTQAERAEMYRRNAIDREQARYERDYAAKQRAKRRQQEREALAKKWEERERFGL
jgi:hypothetical protein